MTIKRWYTRLPDSGAFPAKLGPPLEVNLVARYWRPIVDLTQSDLTPHRLQLTQSVNSALAGDDPYAVLWYSRIAVAGLRHQVLRHAGLDEMNAASPQELDRRFWTEEWEALVRAISRFAKEDGHYKAAVIFQLVQLSYYNYAIRLHGSWSIGADARGDFAAYHALRALARLPGHLDRALAGFDKLSATTPHRALRVLSAGKAIALAARRKGEVAHLVRYLNVARTDLEPRAMSFEELIARSRLHRAIALVRLMESDYEAMWSELERASNCHAIAAEASCPGPFSAVLCENERILLETDMKAQIKVGVNDREALLRQCEQLLGLDPTCVDARLLAGEVYCALKDFDAAAHWFSAAGALGTSDGASGWYRAGQCYALIGEHERALQAMANCLELDSSAVEPREFLAGVRIDNN